MTQQSAKPKSDYLVFDTPEAPRRVTLTGRVKWAMDQLLDLGSHGCSTLDRPAISWPVYVYHLRHDHQINVETVHEKHGGTFAGKHARYFLKSKVRQAPLAAE